MNPDFDAYALGTVLQVRMNEKNRPVAPEPVFKPFDLGPLRAAHREADRPNRVATGGLPEAAPELLAA